jgi:hypothetical protein
MERRICGLTTPGGDSARPDPLMRMPLARHLRDLLTQRELMTEEPVVRLI